MDSNNNNNKFLLILLAALFGVICGYFLHNSLLVNVKSESKLEAEEFSLSVSTSSTPTQPTATTIVPLDTIVSAQEVAAVIYHAFDLVPQNEQLVNNQNSRSVSKFLWRAVFSALSLRLTITPTSSQNHFKVFLLVNYPPSVIDTAKRIWNEKTNDRCFSVASPGNFVSYDLLYGSQQQQQSFAKTFPLCSSFASSQVKQRLDWPFDDVLFPKSPSSFEFKMKADALDVVNRFQNFPSDIKTVLYLDSDTFINKPLTDEILSIFSSPTQHFLVDIAMVQEYNWHRDLSPFLYEPVLRSEVPMLNISERPMSWWTPHYDASRKKPSKKNPSSFGTKNHALYEIQYNTGVILIKNIRDRRTQKFFQFWSDLHRSMPRCRDDKVLWDQCSLPHAIRHFNYYHYYFDHQLAESNENENDDGNRAAFRVATISDRLNFREALGSGCSELLYNDSDTSKKIPNFNEIVVFHSFEVKKKQDDWMMEQFV